MYQRFSLATVSLFLLAACSSSGDTTHITQDQLLARIKQRQAPVIIDVRSAAEYNSGHVPGAIHIPFWSGFTTDELDKYPQSELLVIYCAHGPRAGIAKMAFALSGFDNLRYLQGHMIAWQEAHLPVQKPTQKQP